ncbi:MAG TPA: excinuclease ABC subunit UvrC [Planctomycetota bacterium]|nr:excinuclease ABC subunit UvrC [Planctomycetota bacterium]
MSALHPDLPEDLLSRAARLPAAPGVYVFKDAEGRALYVGKASDLRARVRQYVLGNDTRPLVRLLLRRAADVEVVQTRTAAEALLLENTRIKTERPPYNLRLKDDKAYLVLRVDRTHPYPRLKLVRRIQKDGALYFGPFASAKSVRRTVAFLRTLFPLRSCSDRELEEREKPCLYHQIGRCAAPCVDKITPEAYAEVLDGALAVLRGRDDGLLDRLRAEMERASDALEFERAALLRDRLEALEQSIARQQAVSPDMADRDVVAVATGEGVAVVAVLFVRDGHLVAARAYPQRTLLARRDVLTAFLAQFHAAGKIVPPEVLVEEEPDDVEGVAEVLSGLRGGRVDVRVPRRGAGVALVTMAQRHAALALEEHSLSARAAAGGLAALATVLGLPTPPARIEGYDLSHTAGREPVAAMAVLAAGVPDKDSYRHFAIREAPGGDDYAGMAEVLRRRFARGAGLGPLPDLVLIDGGPGQVAAALEAIRGLGVEPPAVVGLAKARRATGGAHTPERIVVPGREEPLVLAPDDPALRVLVRVRDEAHRFAGRYQAKRRSAALTGTALDGIPGLGPRRRLALLTRFGSVEGIRHAPFEDLSAVPGVGERVAREIRARLA